MVENSSDAVGEVCEEILTELKNKKLDQDDIFAIHLAIEEAFVNAVKHGNGNDPSKKVGIDYRIGESEFEIFVEDEGEGFDPVSVPDPRTNENIQKPNGRGLFLMRAYMDKVEFGGRGNRLHMVRKISSE
ncbi:MAG: ATP-binding protein [Planctomycetes bacterium]|nr:ATP-binding protein [Planctomycetota bacterium]